MARKEQSQRDKDRRIYDIIEASKIIFLDKGYINTTMQDIAEESDLSRRTLYLYFKSKEEISIEIIKNAFTSLKIIANNSIDLSKSGYERLIDFKNAYIKFFKEEFSNFYFTVFFDFKINTQIVSDKDIESCFFIISEIVNNIEDSMKAGMLDGSIRTDIIDTRKKAIAAVNMIQATLQKLAIRKNLLEVATSYTSEELIEETFNIILSSIKA